MLDAYIGLTNTRESHPLESHFSSSLLSPYAAQPAILQVTAHVECNYQLDFIHFTRHYFGDPCSFLFHCLLICLNSASSLTWN